MWKKSYIPLALCLLLLSCPPLAFAQSTTATWESFDQLLQSLRVEIEALSDSLTIVQSALDVSQADLQMVKTQSQAQAARLIEYENSLTQSKQLALSYESRLNQSRNLNTILIITQAASIFLIGYLAFH